jgi:hypothetical protein
MQQDSTSVDHALDHALDLGQHFSAAAHEPDNRPAFRRSVCAFTDERKSRGEPVERIIVQLKHAIRQSHPSGRHLRLASHSFTETDDLITSAVRWCVERYFEQM